MRKLLILLLTLALVLGLPLGALAQEEAVYLTDATAEPGQTAVFVLSLRKDLVASSMAVVYSFDESMLEADPQGCSWAPESVLEDFNGQNMGVWAGEKAQPLKGEICRLSLKVRPGAVLVPTKITCKLILKNGGETVGEFETTATLAPPCQHTLEEKGASIGMLGHKRQCTKCTLWVTESHTWEEGACARCGQAADGDPAPVQPTEPGESAPPATTQAHDHGPAPAPDRPINSVPFLVLGAVALLCVAALLVLRKKR